MRVAPGAYTPASSPHAPPWQVRRTLTLARCVAAVRRYPAAVLTHEAAATVLGLWTLTPEPDIRLAVAPSSPHEPLVLPDVPVTGARAASARRITRSRRTLPPQEVTIVNGLPVTTPLRTAVDCACDLPVHRSLAVIDSALRSLTYPDRRWRESTTTTPLAQAHQDAADILAAQGRRNGVRRARAALGAADPLSESPGESVLRWAALAVGAPAPRAQHEVLTPRHAFFLDVAFPDHFLAWEFDGLTKYDAAADVRDEKRRELSLQRQGWTLTRFGWDDVVRPRALLRRAHRELAGRLPLGSPPKDLLR